MSMYGDENNDNEYQSDDNDKTDENYDKKGMVIWWPFEVNYMEIRWTCKVLCRKTCCKRLPLYSFHLLLEVSL